MTDPLPKHRPKKRKLWKRALSGLLLAALLLIAATPIYHARFVPTLPFNGTEALGAQSWQDFGGLWSLQEGVIFNRSDELGAKVVTGSSAWTDYRLSADMKMLGHGGEVGIIVRANDVNIGINEYRGYYAGFRSMDNSLILGFSDRDWLMTRPIPLTSSLRLTDWLHIEVLAVGCSIGAELTVIRTGETVRSLLQDGSCVPRGKVGLRSLSSGAAWRKITVTAANANDLQAIRRLVTAPEKATYPTREDDLTKMLIAEPGAADRVFSESSREDAAFDAVDPATTAQPIADATLATRKTTPTVLQGTVTHVAPLYIQDHSGGIAVHSAAAGSLNLGDQVEVSGQPKSEKGNTFFEATKVRLLWDDVPVGPVAITSNQAASGLFHGTLVELSGTLLARNFTRNGEIHLRLSAGTEEFAVILHQSLSRRAYRHWEIGSTLRVRGVCAPAPSEAQLEDAFLLLPRSVADVQVTAGPSWTSGYRLAVIILLAVLLLITGVFGYLRLERWKMRAIYEERERLAADMHDTLAQGFAGVGYQLQSLRRGLRDTSLVSETLMRRLDVACDLATDTHREASTRITALHFAAEEEYDVLEVLQRTATLMLGNDSALEIDRKVGGLPHFIPLAVRDTIFRIGHEAIANVLRHSHATRLSLRLICAEEYLQLDVEDNGIGLSEARTNGFGITTMRARAEELNGTLEIEAGGQSGTIVTLRVPYRPAQPLWRRFLVSARRALRTGHA